jgi:hypothetical protein
MRIGLDLDGVLCETPFGRLAVHAPAPVPDLPADYARLYEAPPPPWPLRQAIEYLRFGWRRSAEGATDVLRRLGAAHELHIVTGRSAAGAGALRRWLEREGLAPFLAAVHMAPAGLRPAQHKLAVARMEGIDAHVDDDPRTAYHLAHNGVRRVYLLDHAGAHGDTPLPAQLTLVRSLREFADGVTGEDDSRRS